MIPVIYEGHVTKTVRPTKKYFKYKLHTLVSYVIFNFLKKNLETVMSYRPIYIVTRRSDYLGGRTILKWI
jgi:hypothetical protein